MRPEMTRTRQLAAIVAFLGVCLTVPGVASAIGSSQLAAVQVALRARHLYHGTVDGEDGPATTHAVVDLQRRRGLVPDGIVGPRTRSILGKLGGPHLGNRPLHIGAV